jgi:hypothetical protein
MQYFVSSNELVLKPSLFDLRKIILQWQERLKMIDISQYSILSKVPKWQSCIGEHAFPNNQPEAIVRIGNSIVLVNP